MVQSTNRKDSSISASSATQRDAQNTRSIKRYLSPRLEDRGLIFDAEVKTVDVQSKKFINRDDYKSFQEVTLPRHPDQITVFVDLDTEKATLKDETKGGQGNIMLAKLYLNQLSRRHRFLRARGKLSTLYITNLDSINDEVSNI